MSISRRDFLFGATAVGAGTVLWRGQAQSAEQDERGSAHEILARRARCGLYAREPGLEEALYLARLDEELAVFARLDLSARVVAVHDVTRWARGEGARLGPGAGQAPGSLVCWALGISQVDPIANELVFERFVNWRRGPHMDLRLDVESGHALVAAYARRFGVEVEAARAPKSHAVLSRPARQWHSAEVDRVLAPTQGRLVYDEQVIRVIGALTGADLAEADLARRAFAKGQGASWRGRLQAHTFAHLRQDASTTISKARALVAELARNRRRVETQLWAARSSE